MASLLSKARVLGLCVPLMLTACGEPESPPSSPAPVPVEDLPLPPAARSFSLQRENQGPFMERTVERFHALSSRSDVKSVLWSASGGQLETQGLQATWTLPRAGTASLTLTAETQSGEQLTETFQFRVSAEASSQSEGNLANVPLAPVAVDTSSDSTGNVCDLAFDSTGNGHLIYFNGTHPSIWYGTWNGSTWTTQLVDGMGFNTGGIVQTPMALTLDAAGKPHIVYRLNGRGVWYATLSGSTWIRERVDSAALPPYGSSGRVSIALDPSQGNRPTIAYTFYGLDAGYNRERTVVAYRAGVNSWTAATVPFPVPNSSYDQTLRGEIAFDPTGTLYIPFANSAIGTWKPATTPTSFQFLTNTASELYEDYNASLVRTAAGHLLLRTGSVIVDITPGTTQPVTAFYASDTEAFEAPVGDLVVVGGKPHEIHLHGTSLEQTTPNANNYWTYTSLGTATQSSRIASAQRPTTGVVHYCFQSGSTVTFQ
ncbi:hypothetical protein [Hyalangium versicolor]|uniref:hypothetical protein n=1 Tax=Hyalangium versicolor TaxID=2861190 RepID=UPI001CCEB3B5|nr:hypothetical protein [Hyalangium versicolor]